jgi:hypothetical protein
MSASKAIKQYFLDNPKKHISHNEIRDHLILLNISCKEPQRQVRSFCQKGFLQKVKDGVYFYDPYFKEEKYLSPEFTALQRKEILSEINYCEVCGSTDRLIIDHIIPRDNKNSTNERKNAQVLCTKCNNIKKNNNNIFLALKLLQKEKNSKLKNIINELEGLV